MPDTQLKTRLERATRILKQVSVPHLPQELLRLQQELQARYPNSVTIAQLIARNPELLSPFLELANNTLDPDPPLKDARSAVNLLGLEEVGNVFLAASLEEVVAQTREEKAIIRHGARAGIAAAELSYWVPEVSRADAYLCGLVQNVGGIFMLRAGLPYYRHFHRQLNHPFTAYETELAEHGTAHTFVGAIVARHWHMDETVAETLLRHHDRDLLTGTLQASEMVRRRVALVVLANYIVTTTLGEAFLSEELSESRELAQQVLHLPEPALQAATAATLKWGRSAALVSASH